MKNQMGCSLLTNIYISQNNNFSGHHDIADNVVFPCVNQLHCIFTSCHSILKKRQLEQNKAHDLAEDYSHNYNNILDSGIKNTFFSFALAEN